MRALTFCLMLAVAVACASGDDTAASDGAGDVTDSLSQRVDSTAARTADTLAGRADSTGLTGAANLATDPKPRPATGTTAEDVSVTSTSAAVIGDSILRRDSIIGRDSAFGPRYRVDSTGKLVPIRRP